MKKTVAILAILLLQCISVFSQIQQGQFAERGIPVTTGAGYEVSSFNVNPCEWGADPNTSNTYGTPIYYKLTVKVPTGIIIHNLGSDISGTRITVSSSAKTYTTDVPRGSYYQFLEEKGLLDYSENNSIAHDCFIQKLFFPGEYTVMVEGMKAGNMGKANGPIQTTFISFQPGEFMMPLPPPFYLPGNKRSPIDLGMLPAYFETEKTPDISLYPKSYQHQVPAVYYTFELTQQLKISWDVQTKGKSYVSILDESENPCSLSASSATLEAGKYTMILECDAIVSKFKLFNAQTTLSGQDTIHVYGGADHGIVGKISDDFEVTPSGQVNYEMLIKTLPGTGGMEPKLSITYNSSTRDGLLGFGFDLMGLSIINRAPSNLDTDGKAGYVNFTKSDKFMLDGARLIMISSDNGQQEYKTENDNFSKIIATGTDLSSPESFTVYSKAGIIYEYLSNTTIQGGSPTDKAIFWLLTKVSDTKGNYYTISYQGDKGYNECLPDRIDYTGNADAGLKPYASIRFQYQNNNAAVNYIYGKKVCRSKIISSIDIYLEETRVKSYKMEYAPVNEKYQLQSVTEYAADGSKKNPTLFSWYNIPQLSVRNINYDQTNALHKALVTVGDFNGDGKTDFIAVPRSKDAGWEGWKLFLSKGTLFSYSSSGQFQFKGEIQQVVSGDFNGDGYDDIAVKRIYNKKYTNTDFYLSNGKEGGFSSGKCILSDTRNYTIQTVELTGDGAADLFVYYEKSNNYSTIGSVSKADTVIPLNHTSKHFFTGSNWDKVSFGDFNGDGLTDVVNRHDKGYTLFYADGWGTYSNKSSGSSPNNNDYAYFGDFNGDGKTDILLTGRKEGNNQEDWSIKYATGYGFEPDIFPRKFNSKDKTLLVVDINGDGKDDFYAVNNNSEYNNLAIASAYINNGKGTDFYEASGIRTYGLDKWNFDIGDFNGDGKQDFLCTSTWATGSSWDGYQLFLMPEGQTNLLKSITDGMGYTTSIEYMNMSEEGVYERGDTYQYPVSSFSSSWPLVSCVSTPDGIGGSHKTTYRYKNALIHKRGRGNLGFEYFISKDETSGIETTLHFEINKEKYVTALKTSETWLNGRLLSRESNVNELTYTTSYQRTFTFVPKQTSSEAYEYNSGELVSQSETGTEYDKYGNVTKSTVTSGTYQTVTENTYKDDTERWLLGRLVKAVVTKTGGKQAYSHSSEFTYDPVSGLLTSETAYPEDHNYGYRKSYIHDVYGNIIKSTTTPLDTKYKERSTTSCYDKSGRFLISSANALGQENRSVVDNIFGVPVSQIDENNIQTDYSYNHFGELQKATTPLGYEKSVVAWSQGNTDAPAHAITYKYVEQTGHPGVLEFYDILGRVVRKVTVGMDGKKIYQDNQYNKRGELIKSSEPYFAGDAVYWNTNEYDAVGRVVKQTAPDGNSYTMEYEGLTVRSTDPLGHTTSKIKDIHGNLIESIDAQGTAVQYEYNIDGKCTVVHAPRTVVKTEYDDFGNRIRLEDPDLGTWRYTYNAYGELVEEESSKGTVNYKYDQLGRLLTEKREDGTVNIEYDTKWIGAVTKSEKDNGVFVEYDYDNYGRLAETTENIQGKTFTLKQTYNKDNQLETITYPTGLKVKNHYSPTGYLNAVSNVATGKYYWTANTQNARGQLEKETLGNGLVTEKTYNKEKGYVTSIKTPGIQNWEYGFNAVGNLISRKDVNRNMTESFDYDILDRLVTVSYNAQVKQTITYDVAGNILSKTNVSDAFSYQSGTNRLTSIKAGSYNPPSWDRITYSSFNKIVSLVQGEDSLNLVYGINKERKLSMITHEGKTDLKYYVGSLYEEEYKDNDIKGICYIFAGTELVAILKDGEHGKELRYVHHDHLGSIQAYSDETGNLAQELSYDAWGLRRDPVTWEYYETAYDAGAWHERGFTGHEHLDLFELVNMDGRIYDPVLGRFLSPDPIVQAPDFSQSLNRYAYCLNNPLSLYDPSGYSWFSKNWKSLAAAVVGIVVTAVTAGSATGVGIAIIAGAVGGAAGALTGALLNGANFKQVIKSTLQGALIGAASGFFSYASGGGTFLERLFKHTFSEAWLEGIQGGNMLHGMMMGAISSTGNYYIDKYADFLGRVGKIASSAVLGGTVSEIGGGKFANGAITGAFSMMFNDMMHPKTWHIWFKGKNARHRAYEYMLRRSKEMGIEIAAINLENNEVLVYKEVGNTETSSCNYFDNEKSNEFTFRYKGKKHTVLALGEVHTHPIWDPNSDHNPLMISDLDYDLAMRRFEGTINILVVPTKQLFNVDVRFKNRTNLNEVEW